MSSTMIGSPTCATLPAMPSPTRISASSWRPSGSPREAAMRRVSSSWLSNMMEPILARTARMVLWSTEASRSWIFGMRAESSTTSLRVPSLKTRSSRRCVEARRSSSIWWKAPASWPISATCPSAGTRPGCVASGRGSSARMGRLTSRASRAIWSTSRLNTTKPRQAMMTAMKAANCASVFVMRSETDRKATNSMRGSTATRTKMTAAASRRLMALDTKRRSLMGGWNYCKIPGVHSPS